MALADPTMAFPTQVLFFICGTTRHLRQQHLPYPPRGLASLQLRTLKFSKVYLSLLSMGASSSMSRQPGFRASIRSSIAGARPAPRALTSAHRLNTSGRSANVLYYTRAHNRLHPAAPYRLNYDTLHFFYTIPYHISLCVLLCCTVYTKLDSIVPISTPCSLLCSLYSLLSTPYSLLSPLYSLLSALCSLLYVFYPPLYSTLLYSTLLYPTR